MTERQRLTRNLRDYKRILEVIRDARAVSVLHELIADAEQRLYLLDRALH